MARSARLPKRFPIGTRYVVEGRPGKEGMFQIFARYVVFPNGRRVNLPAKPVALNCECRARRRHPYRFRREQTERPARLSV